jgi:putative ABC transport system ATP-binding protein
MRKGCAIAGDVTTAHAKIKAWQAAAHAPYPLARPFRESAVPFSENPPDSDMIRLVDVHLKLESAAGPVNILRGIDLTVAPGERVAIIGPSGSGKSTLLMVIGGLERPTSGQVLVGGEDLVQLDEDRLARFRRGTVGIVFQSFHLIATMSALENVAVPLELAGHADAFTRAAEELDRVGLAARTEHYPGQLSGGEQQRVALARAFAIRPRLLLADEPTGNLDGETGRAVSALMFDLAQRYKTTLLLVTHEADLADCCGRVLQIQDGRIFADRPAGLRGAAALA